MISPPGFMKLNNCIGTRGFGCCDPDTSMKFTEIDSDMATIEANFTNQEGFNNTVAHAMSKMIEYMVNMEVTHLKYMSQCFHYALKNHDYSHAKNILYDCTNQLQTSRDLLQYNNFMGGCGMAAFKQHEQVMYEMFDIADSLDLDNIVENELYEVRSMLVTICEILDHLKHNNFINANDHTVEKIVQKWMSSESLVNELYFAANLWLDKYLLEKEHSKDSYMRKSPQFLRVLFELILEREFIVVDNERKDELLDLSYKNLSSLSLMPDFVQVLSEKTIFAMFKYDEEKFLSHFNTCRKYYSKIDNYCKLKEQKFHVNN